MNIRVLDNNMELWKLMLKSIKSYKSESLLYSLSGMISIMVIYTYLNILGYAKEIDVQTNILALCVAAMILVFCISIIFMKSAMSNYIQVRSEDYNLLKILGICNKDLIKIQLLEYGIIIVKTILSGLVLGTLLSVVLIKVFHRMELLETEYSCVQLKFYILSVLVFVFAFLISILSNIKLFKRKIDYKVIKIKEKSIDANKVKNNVFILVKSIGLLTGIGLEIVMIYLVLKQIEIFNYIAVLVNILGILLIIYNLDSVEVLLKRYMGMSYFKHIITIKNFNETLKENRSFMYSLFLINFLIMYLCGLISISFISVSDEYKKQFTYDLVVIEEGRSTGANMDDIKSNKKIIVPYVNGLYNDQNVKILSIEDIKNITDIEVELKDNECLFIAQCIEEKFSPVNDEEVLNVKINNLEKSINVKNAIYKYVYGGFQNRNEDLIIVDKEYFEQLIGTRYQITFLNFYNPNTNKEISLLSDNLQSKGFTIYDKNKMIRQQKISAILSMIMVDLAGALVMIEGAFVMYVQLVKRINKQRKKYSMFIVLGMNKENIARYLRKEYNEGIRLPILISVVTSLFISSTYIYMDSGNSFNKLTIIYVVFTVICYLIEEIYFLFLKKKVIKEVYKCLY